MPEQARTKNHFVLNKGLNTESNEISFPDGYTTDELNYELLIDGSRRRRKGLQQETGGATRTLSGVTIATGDSFTSYRWRGVAGNPATSFIVTQIGAELHFSVDDDTPSNSYRTEIVDLSSFVVDGTTSATTVAQSEAQYAVGRGVLLVTHPKCNPIYVEYEAVNDQLSAAPISILIRDFYGIDDGVADQITPATLTDTHRYNLRNRGWISADLATYEADAATSNTYPSKSAIWHRGYRRITDVGFSDLDGIQIFNPEKITKEQFGTSSAPQGSLILNPLDTTYSASNTNEGTEIQITGWSFDSGDPKAGGTINVLAVAHGRSTNDFVTISGNKYITNSAKVWVHIGTLDGYWQITRVDDDNFTLTYPANSAQATIISGGKTGNDNFFGLYASYGQVNGGVSLPKGDGETLSVGPTSCAYHAGRAWYAGVNSRIYADTIFFSKIALEASAFGICHQESDPTNPHFNALSSSDGGHIVIPNLGNVLHMTSLRDSLLIFTDQGVWEIGGGQRGVFTAGGYSVRKITEAECSSSRSPIVIGNRALYTGPRGIHVIAPNKFTSVLEETSMSEQLVQTLWNDIPVSQQQRVWTAYDDARDRIYFLYDDGTATDSHHYQFALVLDLRVGAYYKYQFNEATTVGVCGAFAVTDSDSSNSNKKIKFIVDASTTTVNICDLDQTDYLDFDGAESPLPYFTTGWDNVGEFQRRKQAPVITVYAKRTETGYTASGNGWDGDNESSNLLTAYWDWTDDSVSGKIGSQNETYRNTRAFVPSASNDVSGYPVVVTRNKVRGRGRVLQLRFDGAATKDSHILGFSTNYKITRKV